MRLLGIDYGRVKIGLALATSNLATPLRVVKYTREEVLFKILKKTIEEEEIDKVVVGISEGEMAKESKAFGERLRKKLGVKVDFSDETLSTADAQLLAVSAGVSRKKRRNMEDAYAATLMLQNYIDVNA